MTAETRDPTAESAVGESFVTRHVGPGAREQAEMLQMLGLEKAEELVACTVPEALRLSQPLRLPAPRSEHQLLRDLRDIGRQNQPSRSFIGLGYADCITPPVIQRNILENPAWYTQYTPYQSEIAQGRLEALFNFQTMIADLTGLDLANASLLDEATAAAEAMTMIKRQQRKSASETFFVSDACHPQTKAVIRTRAAALDIEIVEGDCRSIDFAANPAFGALLQYPDSDGALHGDLADFCKRAHEQGVAVAVAADLLCLCLFKPPGEFGADVVVGSSQRFGMPMGYGGPHAAYLAAREEFKRQIPGRIIGLARDALGNPALRMALQTREQHIRREKATSNICTSQVLPAVVAGFFGVYHGPEGLRRIAEQVHGMAILLASEAERLGYEVVHASYFDTVRLTADRERIDASQRRASKASINLRALSETSLCIAVDEATDFDDIDTLVAVLGGVEPAPRGLVPAQWNSEQLTRKSPYLAYPVFHRHRSETELLRYINRLGSRDLSLTTSMIPLGSCTMKLNATAEMMPITWPEFASVHPFAPPEQNRGYQRIFSDLEDMLAEITGLAGISLQPNAGSQGEYAGLLVIARHHQQRGERARNVCLIPASAHGTNPASAAMAGMRVVVVDCDDEGNIDRDDLRDKAQTYADVLSTLMVTYPSTHGVFEESIVDICEIIHARGGQVYMDGANMNAMVGLCRPGDFGVDACHLNLHKTFCIPHGGGGPGMGPIAVASHLEEFLPGHPLVPTGGGDAIGPVAAAPWSSAVILLISWAYLRLMGTRGLETATRTAILNANYLAKRLEPFYPVLYRGRGGLVAHEAILDLRSFGAAGVDVDDVAKRLMDYGFHAPTVHFPVPGTLMVEPTESESKAELDRFCDAMISIRGEIDEIVTGIVDVGDSPLKHAPHTLDMVLVDDWPHSYSRQKASRPAPWTLDHKFWPAVARVDNADGDRNLVCTCPPIEAYAEDR